MVVSLNSVGGWPCVRSVRLRPSGGTTRRSIERSWTTRRGCRPTTCCGWRAGFAVRFYDTLEDFYLAEALEYITAWRQATPDRPAGICGPIGPTEQLPLVARLVNELELDLRHCHFWGMDEWVVDGQRVPRDASRCASPGPTWSCASIASGPSCGCRRANFHFPTADLGRVLAQLRPGALRRDARRAGRGQALGVQRSAARAGDVQGRSRRRRPSIASCDTRMVDLHPMTIIQNARTSGGGVVIERADAGDQRRPGRNVEGRKGLDLARRQPRQSRSACG